MKHFSLKHFPLLSLSLPLVFALPATAAPRVLDNGVTVVSLVDRTAPRVSISLLLRVGASEETSDTAGWRRLLLNAMLRAAPRGYETTKGLEAEALSRAAQNAGGEIGGSVGDDLIEITATGDSAQGLELLKLALALIRTPRLSDEDLDNARERQLDLLEDEQFDIAARIGESLREQLFRAPNGDLVAYGLPEYGSRDSIKNLDNAKLRELFEQKIATAKLTVSVAGDVDSVGVESVLRTLPASATQTPAPPVFKAMAPGTPPLIVREFPTRVASVFVTYPLANFSNADAPALRVLVAALTEAKDARLPKRLLSAPLVDGAPVAFTVSSQWVYRRHASELLLSAQTGPQNVDRVKNALLDEVNKLRQAKLSPTELQRAKNYARGTWSIERQSLRERAFLAGQPTALGAPADEIWPTRLQSVSAEQVSAVAQKLLKSYAVALVMPRDRDEE